MVSLVALIVWRTPLPIVLLGFLVFGALDGAYLSSALTKVPDGAWFTLILAILLSSIFVLWRFGKENQWQAEASDRLPLSTIITQKSADRLTEAKESANGLSLTAGFGGAPLSSIDGMGIFFDKDGLPDTTPTVFVHFLRKFQAAPRVAVFFHIRPISLPSVPLDGRFTISRCLRNSKSASGHQFFRVTLRHGYMDEVISKDLGLQIYEQLRNFVVREAPLKISVQDSGSKSTDPAADTNGLGTRVKPEMSSPRREDGSATEYIIEPTLPHEQERPAPAPENGNSTREEQQQQHVVRELSSLESAYGEQVVYIVGKEQMRIHDSTGYKPRSWCRRIALVAFMWLRSNTGNKIANWNVDIDKLVEIGFVKII
ncbi:MAG: hypothetical protein Q9220_003308 [cf. Caloplaca sp. 1 TL-2023]